MRNLRRAVGPVALVAALGLSGCAVSPPQRPVMPPPPAQASSPPAPADEVPDAVPQVEPIVPNGANRPYEALGQSYVPFTGDEPFRQRGIASWYGGKFHGRRTASGERFDMYAMTAAHPTLPIPSYVRVRNPANDREVIVRINDRGPFHRGRIIDLSYVAARKLDLLRKPATVEIERLTNDDIRAGRWQAERPD